MRRSHFSHVNLKLLEQNSKTSEQQLNTFGEFIRPDEEDANFMSDLYQMHTVNDDELRQNWRVYTAMNSNDDANMHARRLENAAWRLQVMRNKRSKSFENLQNMPQSETKFVESTPPIPAFQRTPDAMESIVAALKGMKHKHKLGATCINDVLDFTKNVIELSSVAKVQTLLPESGLELFDQPVLAEEKTFAEATPETTVSSPGMEKNGRKIFAIFLHSMERNGANNFCLFLLRALVRSNKYIVFAPKDGPMKSDFQSLSRDIEVIVIDPNEDNFLTLFETYIREKKVSVMLANTIMRCDVIVKLHEINIPSIWVIHESWPKDKLEYYAQEVFLRKNLSAAKIKEAFRCCKRIVFPSTMQKMLYKGLYSEEAAVTVYNGIPLKNLDAFKAANSRAEARRALGYKADDFLVLHIGTICGRKGQVYTAQACSSLIKEGTVKNLKVLMVGARYIRDHEIAYIDAIKKTIEDNGCTWGRFEEQANKGSTDFTLMDIQKKVLRFYLAADVVVVPSLNEVLPLVICEAMAFERPVICSQIDAIPEAVADNVEGFLVPPGNPSALKKSILKLFKDPALRKRFAEAGRKRVLRQFSYTKMNARYFDMFENQYSTASARVNDDGGIKRVLVDLDNTVVNWDREFIKRFSMRNVMSPDEVQTIVENRTCYEIEKNFAENLQETVLDVVAEPGFYASLEPYEGAIEALKAMASSPKIDVRIVTSPHPTCPGQCSNEKYDFVVKHLGKDWVDKLIIARDKTVVLGDFLIDDKPKITGSNSNPTWKQVHFLQSYNRDFVATQSNAKSMAKWNDWTRVLSFA